jgi:hypothetical protein
MGLPLIQLDPATARALQNGQTPLLELDLADQMEFRAYSDSGVFIGIARATKVDRTSCALAAVRLMSTGQSVRENA